MMFFCMIIRKIQVDGICDNVVREVFMRKRICIGMILVLTIALMSLSSCGKEKVEDAQKLALEKMPSSDDITLESYEDSAFTMEIPEGWKVITSGELDGYGIYIYDPEHVERQIFYYISLSTYFSNQEMKDFLGGYTNTFGSGSAYEQYYANMPVLSSGSPEEVFETFTQAVQTRTILYGNQEYPVLDGFELIDSQEQDTGLGNSKAMWAKFYKNNTECSGQFMANVYGMDVSSGMMGYAQGSFYVSNMVMGFSAASSEFYKLHDVMLKSLTSLRVKQSFVDSVTSAIEANAAAALKRNETMQEAYDSYNQAWSDRNKTYDAISAKNSYATLGNELLYNPDTDDTYTVSNDFYETYKKDPSNYNITNLEPVPDSRTDLWTK